MDIRFTQSARKHRIGKARAKYVIRNYEPILVKNEAGIEEKRIWVGRDDRGLELEIVAVAANDYFLVIHVMPTIFRKANKRWYLK
jgi:hypothetical protein